MEETLSSGASGSHVLDEGETGIVTPPSSSKKSCSSPALRALLDSIDGAVIQVDAAVQKAHADTQEYEEASKKAAQKKRDEDAAAARKERALAKVRREAEKDVILEEQNALIESLHRRIAEQKTTIKKRDTIIEELRRTGERSADRWSGTLASSPRTPFIQIYTENLLGVGSGQKTTPKK